VQPIPGKIEKLKHFNEKENCEVFFSSNIANVVNEQLFK
jgi:hypothetical protein